MKLLFVVYLGTKCDTTSPSDSLGIAIVS